MTDETATWHLLLNGRALSIGVASIILGRASSCDIVLDDPLVSREHARLWRQGSQVMIEDMGSRHGVFVNDKPIRGWALLRDGDRVLVGPYEGIIVGGPLSQSITPRAPETKLTPSSIPPRTISTVPAAAASTHRDISRMVTIVIERLTELGDTHGARRLVTSEIDSTIRRARSGEPFFTDMEALAHICIDLQAQTDGDWLARVLAMYQAVGAVMRPETAERLAAAWSESGGDATVAAYVEQLRQTALDEDGRRTLTVLEKLRAKQESATRAR